jgi:transposase-like protein
VAGALKPLYTAENEQAALAELEKLEHKHGDNYPTVILVARRRRCTIRTSR